MTDDVLNELRELRAEVRRLADRLPIAEGQPPPDAANAPVTSWRAAAAALGISEDTIHRRRREIGDDRKKPYFDDIAAVRRWYARALGGGPSPAPTSRPSRPAKTSGLTLADLKARKNRGR